MTPTAPYCKYYSFRFVWPDIHPTYRSVAQDGTPTRCLLPEGGRVSRAFHRAAPQWCRHPINQRGGGTARRCGQDGPLPPESAGGPGGAYGGTAPGQAARENAFRSPAGNHRALSRKERREQEDDTGVWTLRRAARQSVRRLEHGTLHPQHRRPGAHVRPRQYR